MGEMLLLRVDVHRATKLRVKFSTRNHQIKASASISLPTTMAKATTEVDKVGKNYPIWEERFEFAIEEGMIMDPSSKFDLLVYAHRGRVESEKEVIGIAEFNLNPWVNTSGRRPAMDTPISFEKKLFYEEGGRSSGFVQFTITLLHLP